MGRRLSRLTPRRAIAIIAILTAATTAMTTISSAADQASPGPLRIMLTNDDGWNAAGITAVYDALVAAGHQVTLVAPLTNQSGVGARATFGGSLTVKLEAANKYSVSGSPADAVEVGLSVVYAGAPPDLVISGTNAGQNIGAATVHSGTVGAAVTALNDGVPAIAVSTEINFTNGQGPYTETAAFIVDLLSTMQTERRHGNLLPLGVGLNVNYPLVEGGGSPAGVASVENGRGFLDLDYTGALPATVGASTSLGVSPGLTAVETVANSDTAALAANQIAISAIEPDYDTSSDQSHVDRIIREVS